MTTTQLFQSSNQNHSLTSEQIQQMREELGIDQKEDPFEKKKDEDLEKKIKTELKRKNKSNSNQIPSNNQPVQNNPTIPNNYTPTNAPSAPTTNAWVDRVHDSDVFYFLTIITLIASIGTIIYTYSSYNSRINNILLKYADYDQNNKVSPSEKKKFCLELVKHYNLKIIMDESYTSNPLRWDVTPSLDSNQESSKLEKYLIKYEIDNKINSLDE